jgi:hypothetical protein
VCKRGVACPDSLLRSLPGAELSASTQIGNLGVLREEAWSPVMKAEETKESNERAASSEGEMHRPPSVLWLVIPLLLMVIYAATR